MQNNDLLLEGFDVDSGVSEQPVGDTETKQGAINRAKSAYEAYILKNGTPPCYSVGLEGGISTKETNQPMECSAWMVVYNGKTFGSARTATFMLPGRYIDTTPPSATITNPNPTLPNLPCLLQRISCTISP